jgi:hypothetical protein
VAGPTLTKGAVRMIHQAVDRVFDKVKGRVIGPDFISSRRDKDIFVGYRPDLSLPGIYRQAAMEEATVGNETVVHGLAKVAEGYIDAQREVTKAKVLRSVNAWLTDSAKRRDKANIETVLGGELADVWGRVMADVTKIVDTEGTAARNLGTLEGITKVNVSAGIEDPVVYFVVVRDKAFWECGECPRLHLLADEVTPRVWRLSEVSSGYHKRGENAPCTTGLHPHCRCTIATLMPGYGFDTGGHVRFIEPGHDEFARQRG